MGVRASPGMTSRCVLTWITMTLLSVQSVRCTSPPSTLNPRVTDSSRQGERFPSAIPHMSSLSALLRIRRSLPSQRLMFPHDPTAADADPPFVILLLGQRRHGQEPHSLAWGHTRDYQSPGPLTRPQGHPDNHIPGSVIRPQGHPDNHIPGSVTRAQGHPDNHIPGAVTWPRAHKSHQRGGISDCLTPCYEGAPSVLDGNDIMQDDFLGQTLYPGLMTDPTRSKLLFKKKKQKKTQEIRQALNRRYAADFRQSNDASEDSFLKEQQILEELMNLQKMLIKHQQTVKSPSLNDMQGWSGEDQYLLTPREAAPGYLADDRDVTLGNQPLSHVQKPTGSSHKLDGHEVGGHILDRQIINLQNTQPLVYSADRKLSVPNGSVNVPSVSMDAVRVQDKQPLSQSGPDDPAGHAPGDDLQYSSMNDVFQPDPGVSTPEKHNLVSLHGAGGHFLDNDKDCQVIASKDCLSDMDCSCSGFYSCSAGRCTLLQGDKSSANKDDWMDAPADQHGWVGGPTDQYGWAGGPKDQYGWMGGPTDQQVWVGGPKHQHIWVGGPKDKYDWVDGTKDQLDWVGGANDQHGFVDGPINQHGRVGGANYQHGFVDGPINQHDWSNDPVMFELVPEKDNVRSTEKQVWHDEPFDFSETAAGADLQPHINAMFGQQPKYAESMGSHPVLEQAVGDQFWASGQDGFSDSGQDGFSDVIRRSDRKRSWSPDTPLLVDELGVVEG